MSSSRQKKTSLAREDPELADPRSSTTDGQASADRVLAIEALQLLLNIDGDIREARAQFNSDWFRRLMRIRHRLVSRVKRRSSNLIPPPAIRLGGLRRRYHAHIAMYLYKPDSDC